MYKISRENLYLKKFLVKKFSEINSVKNIGVVGSGQMGSGIAYVFGRVSKHNVFIYDSNKAQLEKCSKYTYSLLDKEITKGLLKKEEKEEIVSKFNFTADLSVFKNCQFVIEAIPENFELKSNLFKSLDEITNKDVILASNTSSISITKLAAVTSKPQKVIGMHFMNPVPVMKLVEVIKGLQTSDDTFQQTTSLVNKLNKEYSVARDIPGFIANRILMPYLNEAIFALYEGIGSVEDIDKTMKLGTNVPMGPLTLADFIGLDTVLYILQVLYNELRDPKYRPCPLLVNYVDAGWFGRKNGKGFYDYTGLKK